MGLVGLVQPAHSARRTIRALTSLLLVTFLASCGGSGSGFEPDPDPDDPTLTVEGTVQKGLFTTLNVLSYPVDETNGELGDASDVQVDGQLFTIDIPDNELTLFEARGEFTSEVTGRPIFTLKPLMAIILPGTDDRTANINIATTIIAELVLRDLRAGGVTDVAALIQQHTDFVNEILGFPPGTDPTQLDFNNIDASSDLQDANLQLLMVSSAILQSLDGPRLYSGGFQAILDGILAANSVAEASAVLSVLEGVSADLTYDLARQYSGMDLPELVIGNRQFVYVCELNAGCTWIEVFEPGISIASTTAWEAEGQARVFVRTSEANIQSSMDVILEVRGDTATEGEDLIARRIPVTIPIGLPFQEVDVDLIIDTLNEGSEQITLSLEATPSSYPIFKNAGIISLYNGVKPSLDTPDSRDPTGLDVQFNVAAVCNPVFNMGDEDCRTLDGTENLIGIVDGRSTVARTEVALVGDCTAMGKCLVDWVVDFFLVARDGSTFAGEEALGSFVVESGWVRNANENPFFVSALVSLSDFAPTMLAADAAANGWDLSLEARVGSENTISVADPIAPLVPVPSSVLVGGVEIDLGLVYDVIPGADHGCNAGQYALNAQFVQPGSGEILGSGIVCVDYDPGGAGAGPATLVDQQLDIYGGTSTNEGLIVFDLPPGLYAEQDQVASDITTPIGTAGNLQLTPDSIVTIVNRLHREGWPFLFEIDRVSLTRDGIELGYSDMRYVMDVGYSSQDRRSVGILYSNDIYYRGVEGQSGTLVLSDTGVTGDVLVTGGPGHADHTAYPRARIEWQDFTQSIVDNELQEASINIDDFYMGQATSCTGADCVAGRKDYYISAGTNLAIDGKGFLVGDVDNTGSNETPRWGARLNGDHAWSRPEDLVSQSRMKLAIPGYIVREEIVSNVLMGHLDEPVAGEVVIHPRGSIEARRGNYHPTGLSIGPEIYRDNSGLPVVGDGQDLNGYDLRLDNGVDGAFDLASAPAAKYVMRNSGITGVFNVNGASVAAVDPQFYGYDMDITRFAVRAVDNVLDTETWIDGRLALNGDAGGTTGLDIFFTNLEIDCAAKLGSINLKYEACDAVDNDNNGFTDENCAPSLHAWKTPTDIFAAAFEGSASPSSCLVEPQLFGMQHQLHFEALDKPVAFKTTWTIAGFIEDQESGQLPTYRFDRSEEGDGFPMRTTGDSPTHVQLGSADINGDRYGWLQLRESTVGVPFWNALSTDVRVANIERAGEVVADPSVVLKAGDLAQNGGLTAAQRNKDLLNQGNNRSDSDRGYEIKAAYEWGNTGFGFRLPVYYQPWQLDRGRSDEDAQGRQSRFLGRQLTKDLFVLDANAGINFIEPDRTKLSFGASADFTRLEGIEFQVDLSDPASAAAVDKTLQDLRIINGPLFEPALTDLLDTMDIANRYANRGMEELLRQALEAALKEIGEATAPLTPNNQDPFVTASEVLTQFQSIPQQLIALIENDVEGPINNQLAGMKDDLKQALLEMESAIVNLNNAQSPAERVQFLQTIKEKEEQVLGIVNQVEREIRKIDTQVTLNLNFGLEVLGQALTGVDDAKSAIQSIDLVVEQATSVVDSACSNGLLVDAEGSGFLTSAAERIATIKRVADIIRNSNEWLAAAETIAQNDEVRSQLGRARLRIRDATEEVLAFVEDADRAVSSVICQPDELNAITDKVKLFTGRVISELDGLNDNLVAAYTELLKVQDLKGKFDEHVYGPVSAIRNALDPATDPDTPGDGDNVLRIVNCILYNATHTTNCPFVPLSDPVPDASGDFGINTLHAAGDVDGERDIADVLFFFVEDEVGGLFSDIKTELRKTTAGLLPGAYMTPEQLRRTIVTEIMASTPVKNLREAMDKHFGEIARAINGIGLQIVDQINFVVEDALSSVTGPINDALREATAAVRGIPLQSAGINGFATIAGNELERAHVSAGWTMRGAEDGDSTGFKAALDAESWSAKHSEPDQNTPTACSVGEEESLLDVKISAFGLPINVMAADIEIEKLYLGFTLKNGAPGGPALIPIGIFGGINTIGDIGFSDAVVFDPAFAAALGLKQTYIGASAGAVFSDLTADVAFLVGRVCPGNTVLTDLDPDVDKFLPNLPGSGFTGAYLRGGATIPIIPGGCALNVGVVADFGTWIFVGRPTTFGGLVGGGATGRVACIAALKGKVTVGGSASTDGDLKLTGEGWGVAGVGFDCDPGTWTNVPRSRDDDWCGTGDAQFEATFDNGKWGVKPPKPSAIH